MKPSCGNCKHSADKLCCNEWSLEFWGTEIDYAEEGCLDHEYSSNIKQGEDWDD